MRATIEAKVTIFELFLYNHIFLYCKGKRTNHITFISYLIADEDNNSIADTSFTDNVEAGETEGKQCPLCQENFRSQERLNDHALSVHSVNPEGLARLQSLINGSHWLANKQEKDNAQEGEDPIHSSSSNKGN